MTQDNRGPDPRIGVRADLNLFLEQALELLPEDAAGTAYVREAMAAIEQTYQSLRYYTEARLSAGLARVYVLGAFEVVVESYRKINRLDDPELERWRLLKERAGICAHNVNRLGEELRVWLQGAAQ